jgi:hypothetical protein
VVNPGAVATDFGGFREGSSSWKLHADDVARAVAGVLATPDNVLVHRLEIRALSKNV